MKKIRLVWMLALVALPRMVAAQGLGDVLNEAPLVPVPQQMSYEEYRDMNRRLTVGLALRAIPVPGMLHFYAGETKTGKRLLLSLIHI